MDQRDAGENCARAVRRVVIGEGYIDQVRESGYRSSFMLPRRVGDA